MKSRRMLWVLGAVLLLGAGAAAALFHSRRDVTTISEAAYQAYRDAMANQMRFYFKEARVGYARALELDPTFAMAMLGLARQSGDREQAQALIKRAAREEAKLTERERLHVEMSMAYVERRDKDVIAIARQLHEKYPNDVLSIAELCRNEAQKGRTEEAIRMWEELLAVDPNVAEGYNQIGYAYGYRGDYDKAMEYLKKYQFIAPDSANPLDSLGENQAYAGHYTEAIENLNRALAIKADFSPAYEHLGVVYEGLGERAKAVESYRKAVELADVSDFRAKYLPEALRAAFVAGDRAAFVEFQAERAKMARSPYTEVRASLTEGARALLDGRPAEAERQLGELRPKIEKIWRETEHKSASDPAYFPDWNALMAIAKERLGKTDEAMKLWESNANPPRPFGDFDGRRWIIEGRAHLAALLAKRGDLDAAEKLIAENRKWNPSWAPCRDSEATVAELRRAKVLAAAR